MSLAEDLLLVVFSTMDCTFNWPADGNETPPNNLGYMQLGFLAAAGSKERFEDVASYRQTSSEMETSTERMEKVSSPWPLMFLMFGGVAWWGGCCVFDRQLGCYLEHGQIISNLSGKKLYQGHRHQEGLREDASNAVVSCFWRYAKCQNLLFCNDLG